jgi:hypothetical protein
MKTDIEKRIKIKNRASTAFKANCLMNDLLGVLAGIDDMTAGERADLIRQVAILADNYANEIESYN